VFQINPQGQNGKIGWGLSPVEAVIHTVLSSLQAMIYNTSFFDQNSLPPYIANLAGVPVAELVRFREEFIKQAENGAWKGAFTNSDKLDLKMLRPTNQDMQFFELNQWLARIVFAAFELSPQDFGLTMDINKATSESQERLEQGITNVLTCISEEINGDLLLDLVDLDPKFGEIEFAFEAESKLDAKVQAEIDQIYLQNQVTTPNEVRVRDGRDAILGGDNVLTQQAAPNFGNLFDTTQKTFKHKWQDLY
jgi:hypothetical protein